jgi:multidrug efflux pump subunit AcrA (membrane-fusion protein)
MIPSGRAKKYRWIGVALLLVGIGTWFFFHSSSTEDQSKALGVVKRGTLVQKVTISGNVIPNRKTIIEAPYNGYVRKIYVQVGDHVKEGDPIVSLAQSLRGSAEQVYPMKAPFAGTVVQVLKSEGEFVEQASSSGTGNTLVRIDDLSHMYVDASAPEVEVSRLKIGQEAVIKASALPGKTYHGKVEHISLAAKEQRDWDKSRVEFPVRLTVIDADSALESGMSVVVDITTYRVENVLLVRHEFLRQQDTKYWVKPEQGESNEVEIGNQNDEEVEIKKGVTENEKLKQYDFLSTLKENGS